MGKSWTAYSHMPHLHGRKPQPRGGRGTFEFTIILGRWKYRLLHRAWKGIWVAAREPRNYGAVPDPTSLIRWRMPEMKKKAAAANAPNVRHLAPVETELFRDLLPLVEHCAIRQYDDGDPREVGWFTVKTQGAAWIIQVKDPDSGCSFTAIGETVDKAFETAALLLSCEEAPWEPDTFLAAAKARKKK